MQFPSTAASRATDVALTCTLRAADREDTSTEPQTRVELSLIGTDEARLRVLFDGLAGGGTVRASWSGSSGATSRRGHRPVRHRLAGQHRRRGRLPDAPARQAAGVAEADRMRDVPGFGGRRAQWVTR